MDDALNSLEEWVAVKPDLFAKDTSNTKIRFFVAWNECEQKLGITCSQGPRTYCDRTSSSLATSLSLQSLTDIHKQLSLVHQDLEEYFPSVPNGKSSLIPNIFFGQTKLLVDDRVCRQLENYLEKALNVCGKRLLLSLLFDEHPLSDFEENLQELRLKGHENIYRNAYSELEEVLKLRKSAENMIEMATVYAIEDEVVANVSIALAELYNFQIQPFLQLREISYNCLNRAENTLKDGTLGERRKEEARRDIEEHKHQYLAANEAVQHLYQQYYRKTSELVASQVERLMADKARFGRSAFDVAGGHNRLLRLQVFHCQERLKLLNAIKLSRECQKHQIQQALKKGSPKEERTESEICEAQISILDSKLEILNEEEALLKKQIEVLKNDSENIDVELFYDAVEDLKDLIGDEHQSPNTVVNPQVDSLKAKLQEISRKRANIRNRRKVLVSQLEVQRRRQEKTSSTPRKDAPVFTKRSEKLNDVKKNEEYLRAARLRTLKRLRVYRQKTQNKQATCSKVMQFLDETGNELPPYPTIDPMSSDDLEVSFPLPPEEFLETNTFSSVNGTNNSGAPFSNAMPPAPFYAPPPPPGPPPPPPPPPPPMPMNPVASFAQSNTFSEQLKNLKITKRKDTAAKCSSNLIDLNEILNVRKTLKKFVPEEKPADIPSGNRKKDFHAALHEMRRKIVFEPESSEDDNGPESIDIFE